MCEFTTMGRMPFVGNGRECNIKIVRARKKLQLLQLLNQVDLDRASSPNESPDRLFLRKDLWP